MSALARPSLIFARPLTSYGWLFAACLAGCGSPTTSLPTATPLLAEAPAAATLQSFELWCEDWQLTCKDSANAPSAEATVDPGVRSAISAVFLELLQSPSKLTITRADLDASALQQGLKNLSLDALLPALAQRLDGLGWQRATLAGSELKLEALQEGWLPSQGSLQLGLSTTTSFRFLAGDRLETQGLRLQAIAGGQTAEVRALQFHADNTLTLELSDRTIAKVPSWFIAQLMFEAFGADDMRLDAKPAPTRDQGIVSLFPLLNWLNQPSRSLSLSSRFFSATTSELAKLKQVDPSILAVLSSLESLQTHAQSGSNAVDLKQRAGTALNCNSNQGDLVLSFDKSFGLKRFYAANKGGIGFEFFGVKASSKKAFGSFTVKRIELTPDAYTILDIPLISKWSIAWDDAAKEGSEKKIETICKF